MDDVSDSTLLPASPVLHLDGFDGPMDLLLDLAERQRIDFGRISILGLAEQFSDAMEGCAAQVPLERRADWLVLATRLVLLRSRLLFPPSPDAAAAAEAEAAAEIQRLDERIAMRAAGAWLGRRPLLGIEVFTRPVTAPPREGGYVALMEACLVVLQGQGARHAAEPVYVRTIPDLWRVPDAMTHLAAWLAQHPEGGALTDVVPLIPPGDPNNVERRRTALASTVLAALELARCTEIGLAQEDSFGPIRVFADDPVSARMRRQGAR